MRLKNILITVRDMERAKCFYKEVFGLDVVMDSGSNVMLTQGLVLQEASVWEQALNRPVAAGSNATALYFETRDMEQFEVKLQQCDYAQHNPIHYVSQLQDNGMCRQTIRFYDPDGNLIEVGGVQ